MKEGMCLRFTETNSVTDPNRTELGAFANAYFGSNRLYQRTITSIASSDARTHCHSTDS
jgi:hypothetical protein